LECLELIGGAYLLWGHETVAEGFKEEFNAIKQALLKAQKEHKLLEIIKPSLRLVGNCLQAKAPFVDDYHPWVFIKEITDEEELKLLRRMLE